MTQLEPQVPNLPEGTMVALWTLPAPWPPPKEVVVFRRDTAPFSVDIVVDVRGCFSVRVLRDSQALRVASFQPLLIRGSGVARVVLSARWSSTAIEVWINSLALLPDCDSGGTVMVIESVPDEAPMIVENKSSEVEQPEVADQVERLLVATTRDLEAKLINRTWYDMIKATGLLRLLLLDDQPLVHLANRRHRVHLEFVVIDHSDPPPLNPECHWMNVDPTSFPGVQTVVVDLKQLLALPSLKVGPVTATVRDVIRACANAKGGIHLGQSAHLGESAIVDWDNVARLLGEEPSTLATAGLCRVVLRGLAPLVSAVLENRE